MVTIATMYFYITLHGILFGNFGLNWLNVVLFLLYNY